MRNLIAFFLVIFLMIGALTYLFLNINQANNNEPLPILGFRDIGENGDTIYHTIPDFSFIDQDSNVVTNSTFADKVYVVDFFFIHCPSICPSVTANMLRIYERFENNSKVKLLAHSIDTKNDTIPALKAYAEKLEVSSDKWHFVTGDNDKIYELADKYFVTAKVDPTVPGGFDHSGRIILVDQNRHVRAFADGTNKESVDRFMEDIEKLLNEQH